MKKIIALALCVMMLATLTVGTSAAGQILFTDDFTNGFSPNNWILEGNLYFLDDTGDDNCLAAYSDGVVCQAEYRVDVLGDAARSYTNCDYSVRIQIRDFDRDGSHTVGLWWRDDFYDTPAGEDAPVEPGEVYNVSVDADEMIVKLESNEFEEPLATAPVTGVEVGGDWFTLGWRVTPGRMCVFLNGEKLIDYSSEEISAQYASPFLLLNGNCYAAYDDIVIADLEFNLFGDYVAGGADDVVTTTAAPAGDDKTPANTTTAETTTATSNVVVTNEKGEEVTDASGNKVTSQVIITDAPSTAATNTGKPAGGSSTSTGDATFVVVAAMIATLGCAIIVKKANA